MIKRALFLIAFLLLWAMPASATEIMISSYVLDNFQYVPTGSQTVKLRIYCDRAFITGGDTGAGSAVQGGSPPSSKFYREIAVTLGTRITPTGDSIPIATIAQFTIDSTTDGQDSTTSRYSAFFFTSTGTQLFSFDPFTNFRIPPSFDTGVTATWTQIRTYNAAGAPVTIATDTYTKETIDRKIAAVQGITNPMTAMGDLIVGGMSGQPSRLPFSSGATARFLKQTGTSTITTAFVSLASADITTALGFTPLNKAGDTMTGLLTLSGAPTVALHAATKAYVDASAGTGIQSLNGLTGTSFPTQTFAVGAAATGFLTITSAAGAHTFNFSGALPAASGGTTLTTFTDAGRLLYSSSGTALTTLAAAASGNVLLSGASPSWGKVDLTNAVSGILPSANGGTANAFFSVAGPATSTKTYTFPNASASVLTTNAAVTAAQGGTGLTSYTAGDLITATGATTLAVLNIGAANRVLTSNGTAASWSLLSLTASVSGILPIVNGGTGQSSFASGFIKSNGSALSPQALLLYADGGTGAVSYTTNGVVYAGASALLSTALGASGTVLTGTGAAPAFSSTPTIAGIALSGLTLGSIPFASTAGLIAQNNARLFWDNTNFRLQVQGAVRILGESSGFVGLAVPSSVTSYTLTFPNAAPASNGLCVKADISGAITFGDCLSAGTGITTLNTLTASTQTFAVGSTGTDFNISSVTSTHTFNIPSAGIGITRGLVTNASQTIAGVKTLNDTLILDAGTTTDPPGKFQASSLLSSSQANSIEWDNTSLYLTTNANVRRQVAYINDNITGSAASITGNLTGDVTSVGMATTYAAIVPLTKGGLGSSLIIGSAGTFLRSDGAVITFSSDGSALTSLNASNISTGTLDNARLSGVELTANKNAANGYAGLTASTKLNLAQMQEVMASTDLSDFATKNGSGTAILGCTINTGTLIAGHILQYDGAAWVNVVPGAATAHDLLSATHTDTLAAAVAQGSIIIGNATPKWSALAIGANNTVLRSNGTTASWAAVVLSTDVSGILSIANGGTGNSYASATALFNGLDPLTTKGDLLVHNGTDSVRTGVGQNNYVVKADSTQTNGIRWAHPVTDEDEIVYKDEFGSGGITAGNIGQLAWANVAGTVTVPSSNAPNVGVIQLATTTALGGFVNISLANTTNAVFGNLGAQTNWELRFIFKVSSAVTQVFHLGLTNNNTLSTNNPIGIYLRLDTDAPNSDATWKFVCRDATSTTATSSGIAPDTNFHLLRIRSTTAGTILFSLDGGSETAIASNVLTVTVGPFAMLETRAAATKNLQLDLFSFNMSVTR